LNLEVRVVLILQSSHDSGLFSRIGSRDANVRPTWAVCAFSVRTSIRLGHHGNSGYTTSTSNLFSHQEGLESDQFGTRNALEKIRVRRNSWRPVQPANFDFDPVDIFTRRMVKTEKTLDYISGDVFGSLAQPTNTPVLVSQRTAALISPVMGLPYTRPFHENPIPSAPLTVESMPIPM
jgi:hypothetical protein